MKGFSTVFPPALLISSNISCTWGFRQLYLNLKDQNWIVRITLNQINMLHDVPMDWQVPLRQKVACARISDQEAELQESWMKFNKQSNKDCRYSLLDVSLSNNAAPRVFLYDCWSQRWRCIYSIWCPDSVQKIERRTLVIYNSFLWIPTGSCMTTCHGIKWWIITV